MALIFHKKYLNDLFIIIIINSIIMYFLIVILLIFKYALNFYFFDFKFWKKNKKRKLDKI